MTDADRLAATRLVLAWISESQGAEAAATWAWSCTPMPCGLPSDAQLDDGVRVAAGEITIGALCDQVDAETAEALRAAGVLP